MAKPIKDRVPLASYWATIKSGNDTLRKSPLFKPDIMGPISKYDQALLNYCKQLTDQDKLSDFLKNVGKVCETNKTEMTQHDQEREKIAKETETKVNQYATELATYGGNPNADMNAVAAAITNYCAAFEEGVTLYRALSEKMYTIRKQRIAALNKIRDDYKAKAAAIAANMTKYEREVLSLEIQIRGIINNYAKIAIDMNHDDAAEAARQLLAKF